MINRARKALALLVSAALIPICSAQGQSIREVSAGNAVEALTIVIEGEFEPGLADRFERFMESEHPEAFTVALNSPGGSLIEGIKLGSLFRRYELWTSVERQLPYNGSYAEFDTNAICASACAIAFLGGKLRFLANDQQLGFHQFYRAKSATNLIEDYLEEQDISGDSQLMSALLVSYLSELGDIDLNLMLLAANTPPDEMYWVSLEEAAELNITSDSGWSPFWLEPYRNGVVAASRREDATDGYDPLHPYDLVAQATALCRADQRFLMLSTPFRPDANPLDYDVEWSFWDEQRRQIDIVERGAFEIRGNEDQGWLDVNVTDRVASLMQQANEFRVLIAFPRVLGGNYFFIVKPSDEDRAMIDAAFRLCIS